jgi:hypothetical protein
MAFSDSGVCGVVRILVCLCAFKIPFRCHSRTEPAICFERDQLQITFSSPLLNGETSARALTPPVCPFLIMIFLGLLWM